MGKCCKAGPSWVDGREFLTQGRLTLFVPFLERIFFEHVEWLKEWTMRQLIAISLFNLLSLASAVAASTEWRQFDISRTGLSVQLPATIFTEDGGPPEGAQGRIFFTKDHRADLTIKSLPNPDNDSPRAFLEKMRPPMAIQYKRVTPNFFVVSSIRDGRTWYNRCNRAPGFMNCILLNYPAAEDRQWDAIGTRISLSLAK
jgi:hypothetical protein